MRHFRNGSTNINPLCWCKDLYHLFSYSFYELLMRKGNLECSCIQKRRLIMKKNNYLYYAFLGCMMCALILFIIPIKNVLGLAGYMVLLLLFVFYCALWPFIFYDHTKKKGLKDTFYCSHFYELDCSSIWIDTIHEEFACLYLFNPFQIQYISLNRIHDASIRIKDFPLKQERYISYMTLRFSIDHRKHSLRIMTSGKLWIHADSTYAKQLTEEMSALTDFMNHSKLPTNNL